VVTAAQMERIRRRQREQGEEVEESEESSDDGEEPHATAVFLRGGESVHWCAPVTGMLVIGCNHLAADAILGPRRRNGQKRVFLNTPRPDTKPQRKDVVAAAARLAMDLIDNDAQVNIRNGKSVMTEYSLADTFVLPADKVRNRGWAERPAHGKMYGATYIAEYRDKIAELFNRGVEASSNKQSPAAMLQLLEAEFPNRYSLPQDNELRAEITKLFQKQKESKSNKKKKGKKAVSTSTARPASASLPAHYGTFLSDLLEENRGMTWGDAMKRVETHDNGNFFVVPDGMEKSALVKKLQNKFNNLKTKKKEEEQ
jgi:hypothetical protein